MRSSKAFSVQNTVIVEPPALVFFPNSYIKIRKIPVYPVKHNTWSTNDDLSDLTVDGVLHKHIA